MSDDVTRRILEQDNARLQKEMDDLRDLLGRPVAVTVQSPDSEALRTISQYMPQLTHLSTNMSYVASNLMMVNTTLQQIAEALKAEQGKVKKPDSLGPGNTGPGCKCDQPTGSMITFHLYTQGYCPVGGPVQ